MKTNKEVESISEIISELDILLIFLKMMQDKILELSVLQSESSEREKLIFDLAALSVYSHRAIKRLTELNYNKVSE